MSNKEKVTEQQEKVMTKYDRKLQKREEEKAKAKKEQRRDKLIGVVVVIALVCLFASFPISSYLAANSAFVKINGEDVSRVEFDYNYNIVKNNYMDTYGTYFSMIGMDANSDMSELQYSDTLTFEDHFEQETVNNIIQGKALKAEAEAAGFTYDTEQEYEEFKANLKEYAATMGLSAREYVKQAYGSYATLSNIKETVKEALYTNAYYNHVQEANAPSDDEIQAYYEANKNSFDSVDYYVTMVQAELPTEPTELADTTEETSTENYEPSEAEIEKAMADAKEKADAAVATVTTEGTLNEGIKYDSMVSVIRDWLFDASRAEGDTTVIEDTANNQYYVLSFVNRYLAQTPSADLRIIMVEGAEGQAVLDEWKNGEATAESFGAMADEYNLGTSFTAEGGLYEGVMPTGTMAFIGDWLFDESRVAGDTTAIVSDDKAYSYVLYYVGANDPEWKLNAESEISTAFMSEYVTELSKDMEVDDFKGNLEYIEILAAEEAAAETEATEAE